MTGSDVPSVATGATGAMGAVQDQTGLDRVDCAIILVAYNSARHIERVLDSLPAAADGLTFRCVVVDNASRDETVAVLTSRDDVAVIQAGANLGYAGAINLGRANAGPCRSYLILNPDLVLEPGAITRLREAMAEPRVGVAVPMLLNDDASLYLTLRREPSVLGAIGDAVFGARFPRRPAWLGETIRDRRRYATPQDVAWAGGAAMLVADDCGRAVGDWDASRFFLYSEETDFAARVRHAGYRVRYVPDSRARHEDGGSGRSPELAALLAVNRIRYYEKYHRRPATSVFRAAVVLHYLLRSSDPVSCAALKMVTRRSRWRYLIGETTRVPSSGETVGLSTDSRLRD